MIQPAFTALLDSLAQTHHTTLALRAFCDFPTDLMEHVCPPFPVAAAEGFARETNWDLSHRLAAAFVAAGPHAHWRETYKGTHISDDFMERFGCYCLIGPNAPWYSQQMHAYMVYMPAGLWYPWHQHPAEELYLVLAGEGVFLRKGEPSERLGVGEVSFHHANQPHALLTEDKPVMALVLWRNAFDTPPVLTDDPSLSEPHGGPQ